jgi:formylglycine-generating enzyme
MSLKYRSRITVVLVGSLAGCGSEVVLLGGGSGGEVATTSPGGSGPGAGGDGAGGGWEGVGACGGGLPGPAMIEIGRPDGSAFCIDSTEVTNAHWGVFFDTGRGPYEGEPCEGFPLQDAPDYTKDYWSDPARANLPFARGSWCDYRAYCAWAGKRLCGGRDGARLELDTPVDDDEWTFACSAGGIQSFPYGDVYEPGHCKEGSFAEPHLRDVASGTCEGGWPGLHDMVGNAAEAINLYGPAKQDPNKLAARYAGGAWFLGEPACDHQLGSGMTAVVGDAGGFRCCRTLE